MTPYVVQVDGREVGRYGFTRALMEYWRLNEKHPQSVIRVYNADRCDGSLEGDRMTFDDGLTESERRMLDDAERWASDAVKRGDVP